ncbi:enterochelin esterase domain-containing protein [Streptomyces nigrescens]|uniref:enterochelin esterase domain-containing protein n=1 Tax=Streptomyces nigrescens TaxID=1920 RepID=UPI0036CF76DF
MSRTASAAVTAPADAAEPVPYTVASPRLTRLTRRLEQAGTGEHSALTAEFWTRVEREGTPLIEPLDDDPGHRAVTFLWRGHRATRQVLLLANGLTDPDDLAGSLLTPLPGTEIWYLTRRLRADHRGSYRLVADISPGPLPGAEEPLRARLRGLAAHAAPDPHNRMPLPGRGRSAGSSLFELPLSPPQPWREPRPDAPRGTVEQHRSPGTALGDQHVTWVYRPPSGTAAGPLDVLVLPDGELWFGALGLAPTLDALLTERRIPPLLVLAPDTSGPAAWWHMHDTHEGYADFLADELLPWAATRWPVTADPRRTVVAGQSLGGTAAVHTCLRRPERFGSALAQSPAPRPAAVRPPGTRPPGTRPPGTRPPAARPRRDRLPGTPGAAHGEPSWPPQWFAPPHGDGVRIHLDVARQDGARVPGPALHDLLDRCGHTVTWQEFNGGPDYACWRGGLADGLISLLGS